MNSILVSGLATVDLIFYLDNLPTKGKKYQSNKQILTTGGNAANASIAISRLGGSVVFVGILGYDFFGDFILSKLKQEQINTDYIIKKTNLNSSNSCITIDKNGERQIINYRSKTLDFKKNSFIEKNIFNAYLTDGRFKKATIYILKEAKKNKKPGVLDAEQPVCKDAVIMASHVAFSLQGLENFTNTSSIKKALKIVKDFANNFSCVTDGSNGVYYLEAGELINIKPPKIKAIDTLGAGDVWHGAFTLAISLDYSILNACKFANNAASKKCENFGGINGAPYKINNEFIY